MSVRGEMAAQGPASVQVGALLALEARAARRLQRAGDLAERPGTTPARRRGQGHEIREIRPFVEGDDPRHIDAAATARSGNPQVRSFHEDRERSLLLIADFRRPMLWGTRGRLRSVAAAEALALAGWEAVLEGGAVGALVLTDAGIEVQPLRHRHRSMALVAGCLARAHEAALVLRAPVRPLAPDLARAGRQVPRGAGIVLATGLDLPGEGLDEALAALTARGPLRLLLIEDALETDPPARALPYVGPAGPALARFTGLAHDRARRAAALVRPGLQVRRLSTAETAMGEPR